MFFLIPRHVENETPEWDSPILRGGIFTEYLHVRGIAILPVMDDQYTTIARPARAETKVMGSRFIARCEPVADAEGVEAVLEKVRRELHDATHHCYAYRIGERGEAYRAHDGGEPSGTAGRPILAAIERSGCTDVIVVVTRYFGGTKLGVGGLARAYGDAATEGLSRAGRRTVYPMQRWRISFPHSLINPVMHVLSHEGATIADTAYDEEVHITLEIRASLSPALRESLQNKTSGNIRMLPLDSDAS
jgi:uncharacterized YigZ family protein